jgi:hypothetical protein
MLALGAAALVVGSLASPADAAKTKMGCEKGKQVWNASEGKCVAGTSKYGKKKAKKAMAKKAAAKK